MLLLCLHFSCHSLCGSTIHCYAGAMQLALNSFSERIGVSIEGGDVRAFFVFILDFIYLLLLSLHFFI